MADTEDRGLTALEAVERYCKMWTWAGTVSDDPADREQALKEAAVQLTTMLRHEVPENPNAAAPTKTVAHSEDVRARAVARLNKLRNKKTGEKRQRYTEQERGQAVFAAMMATSNDVDSPDGPEPVRLWATGHKGSAIDTPAVYFSPEQWADLTLDIEDNCVLDGDARYVALKIYDHEPALAAGGAKDDEPHSPGVADDAKDEIPQPNIAASADVSVEDVATGIPEEVPEISDEDKIKKAVKDGVAHSSLLECKPAIQLQYWSWYKKAQEIRSGVRKPSGDLAEMVHKDMEPKVKWESVERTLNKYFPGWAE